MTMWVATGSYGTAGALALWDAAVDGAWQQMASADVDAPSFVCWHPRLPVLYAASEQEAGVVSAWRVAADGALTAAGTLASGGSAPCWLSVSPDGAVLVAANYGGDHGAALAVFPLEEDGALPGEPIVVPGAGSGPVADRQSGPHVHQAVVTPVGTVLVCDLGADAVIEYSVADGSVSELTRLAMPAGSGPRHVALTADGYTGFVAGELDGSVTEIRRDSSSGWHVGARVVPCTASPRVPGEVPLQALYPSHIALAGADRWLLVANRGVGTLAVLDVADELRIVSEAPVADWPRHFAMVDGPSSGEAQVLVAAQRGQVVERLALNVGTGELGTAQVVAKLDTASCVAPRPR